MDDALLEARREIRLKRQARIKAIGWSAIGLIILGVLAAWIAPLVLVGHQAARRRMLNRLAYPMPPTSSGVYPVRTEPYRWGNGTILRTPVMPLEAGLGAAGAPARPLTFEAADFVEEAIRTEPLDTVGVTIYAPPQTWAVHKGLALKLVADGEIVETFSNIEVYYGDGWGLKEHDRLDFNIPTEDFVRIATAKSLVASLDGKSLTITADEQIALRDFSAYLRPGIPLDPPK
jgi:hypothetical protein